jgi:hypothetical protein
MRREKVLCTFILLAVIAVDITSSMSLQPLWTYDSLDGGSARRKAAAYTQTSKPRVWFEPIVPVVERAKTVHALDLAATVIGRHDFTVYKSCYMNVSGRLSAGRLSLVSKFARAITWDWSHSEILLQTILQEKAWHRRGWQMEMLTRHRAVLFENNFAINRFFGFIVFLRKNCSYDGRYFAGRKTF